MNSSIIPVGIRFDHAVPSAVTLGFDNMTPSISWQVSDPPTGWIQRCAEVEVVTGNTQSDPFIYRIEGSDSLFVPWRAPALAPRESASVRVRVQGDDEQWSDWSEPAIVECGLLSSADWMGSPISPVEVAREDRAPVLTRRFHVAGKVSRARLYATAAGLYVAYIDGVRVGTSEFAPGWTDYAHRFLSQSYDVTELLTPGDHELAVVLGNGWYRGKLTWENLTNFYGDNLWLLANLRFLDDGDEKIIATNSEWKWRSSNILENDFYDGEVIDYRLPFLGEVEKEQDVTVLPLPEANIEASAVPPARIIGSFQGQQIINTPSGKTIIDFGQNISGRVRLIIHNGTRGNKVVLRHAEVLENGELGVRPLRSAKCTDVFTLSGKETEVLEAVFALHGFRYVEVGGVDEGFSLDDIKALVISADVEALAKFDCSNALVTRLFENARWSTIDNFISIPTDCPQRDERLGWTGDIGIYAPTALSLFAEDGLLMSWMDDLATEQGKDGGVPNVVPNVLDAPHLTSAWGDSAVLVPWAIYWATSDKNVLRRFLPVMDSFVEGVANLCGDNYLWQGGFQFGDWLDPDAPPDRPGDGKADPDVVATAYFAHSARIVSNAHRAIGDEKGARRFGDLAEHVETAYRHAYVTNDGMIISDCATVYAQALVWNLLETEKQREGAGNRVADLVRLRAFRVSTGFVGTPLICEALSISGHSDLAARLLLQTKCPSWLYAVSMGATTMWERWDSMLPDGSINPGEMTSFNHYSLGAVVEWLSSRLVGLSATEPGYRHVVVKPYSGAGFTHANLCQATPYGDIKVSWKKENGHFYLDLTIPTGVQADVVLPGKRVEGLQHGSYSWSVIFDEKHPIDRGDMTVRDLLDSESEVQSFVRCLRVEGATEYMNDDADVVLARSLKAYRAEKLSHLPKVVGSANPFYTDPVVPASVSFLSEVER